MLGGSPGAARKVARVVLDALAVAHFAEHFQIKPRALLQPLGLHQLAVGHQLLQAPASSALMVSTAASTLVARRHVVAAGVHRKARNLLLDTPGERVEQLQALDPVIKQLDAHRQLGMFGREHIDGVARTRNLPWLKSASLRWYCMRISWAITSRAPTLSPTRSVITMRW